MGGDFSDLWDEDSLEAEADSQSGGAEEGSALDEEDMDSESEGGTSSEDEGDSLGPLPNLLTSEDLPSILLLKKFKQFHAAGQ